jgi:hypothetical protein
MTNVLEMTFISFRLQSRNSCRSLRWDIVRLLSFFIKKDPWYLSKDNKISNRYNSPIIFGLARNVHRHSTKKTVPMALFFLFGKHLIRIPDGLLAIMTEEFSWFPSVFLANSALHNSNLPRRSPSISILITHHNLPFSFDAV